MKPRSLLKRVPTLLVAAFLTYACYSIHASLPDSAGGKNELEGGLDVMLKDLVHSTSDEVRSLTKGMLRDPFRITHKAAEEPKSKKAESPEDSEANLLADFVKGLVLDATFLQGQTRIAIINGRIYNQGQYLVVQGENGNSRSPLCIESVRVDLVTLSARGRSYELAYPDKLGNAPTGNKPAGRSQTDGSLAEVDPEGELAFYKQLLNSPLGRLGKSLTGNLGRGAAGNRAGGASRSPRRRDN